MNTNLTNDRFGNPNSALDLESGYYQVPSGTYFNGLFSIIAWVYLRTFQIYSRLIDFSPNNIIIAFDSVSKVYLLNLDCSNQYALSNKPVSYNVWFHLAGVLGTNLKLFIDGELVGEIAACMPANVDRTVNFIGRSNSGNGDKDQDGVYDEIRIYNRNLNQFEINQLMLEDY